MAQGVRLDLDPLSFIAISPAETGVMNVYKFLAAQWFPAATVWFR
jgi:hypothetical protein